MLETLLEILGWGLPIGAPEILLEEDGCLGLDWGPDVSVSIHPDGKVSWAIQGAGHGRDMDELRVLLQQGPGSGLKGGYYARS